jgi:hypothetical protein
MNLPKFLDLLETQELFFSRLGGLDDAYEGALSSFSVEGLRRQLAQLGDPDPDRAQKLAEETYRLNQCFTFVNCWHERPHESMAMWMQYGEDGIAIRTSLKRFRRALAGEPRDVWIGQVKYGNYANLPMNFGNSLAPVFHKRSAFEFEHEVRAALIELPTDRGPTMAELLELAPTQPPGVRVPVNISELVQKAYVSPGKPAWYRSMLEKVLCRYGYDFPLETSTIDKRPDFNRSRLATDMSNRPQV